MKIYIILLTFILVNNLEWETETDCGSPSLDLTQTMDELATTCDTTVSGCCVLTGIYQLKDEAICVKINNKEDRDERIAKIKEYEGVGATKLKLKCQGENERKLESNCQVDQDPSEENCKKSLEGNKKCCYVEIGKGEQKACISFPDDMDLDTISEAVLAAKTLDVKLKVECSSIFIKYTLSVILLSILFIL